MNNWILAATLLVPPAALYSQATPAPQAATPQPEVGPDVDILHHMRRSTVSLGLRIADGGTQHFVAIGSGVIVAWDDHHACLLTAKHVFYDPTKSFFPTVLYLRIPKAEPSAQEDLGLELKIVENGQNRWYGAADADLAVIPLPDLSGKSDLHAILLKDFGSGEDIFQGSQVVVMGYPDLLGRDYQVSPIARAGIVAWTDPDGPIDHTFLVDANIFGGNSGGPVFHMPTGITKQGGMNIGGAPKLIGIVSKDAYEESPVHAGLTPEGKLNQETVRNGLTGEIVPMTAQVLNVGGIGIIEPVSKAKKLIIETFHLPPQ